MCSRRELWEMLCASGLSAREFATALGVADRTIERHLAGRPTSKNRRSWYRNVQRVFVDDQKQIHIVVRYVAPTRKPADWSREYREKKKRARSRSTL